MRIRTDGRFAFRDDVLEKNADLWDCNKTDAVIRSCEFADRMLGRRGRLKRALDHPDMTAELAEILSTPSVDLRYEVETDVELES